MYQATVHRLGFSFDRTRQALVFTGLLENGFQFEVCFPIAHVVLTFDREAAEMGYIGEPLMGDVETIEGFFSSLKKIVSAPARAVSSAAKSVANVASNAYNKTIKKVGQQAIYYARQGAKFVGQGAKFVGNIVATPYKAAYDIASGKNVMQSLQGVVAQVQTVLSVVPGVGTAAAAGLGGINATLQGKSLSEIAKAVGTGAIPGGPLVAAAAQTAANLAVAGVKGQNILRAARTEIINGAASLIPNPQLRQMVAQAANEAASGKNVLASTKRAALTAAVNQIPDPGARQAAMAALSGKPPQQIIQAAGASYLTKVAAMPNSSTGAIVGGVVAAAAGKPPVRHPAIAGPVEISGPFGDVASAFPALGAEGLAAHHAASHVRIDDAMRRRVIMLSRSRHPSARLAIAGLKSVAA